MNVDQILRIIRFNPLDYVWDFFRALVSLVVTGLAFYSLRNSFLDSILAYHYIPLTKTILEVVLWVFLFFLLKGISNFFKRGVEYNFNLSDWPKKWIFHGLDVVQANPSSLTIQQSRSGCLLKNYLWKNFEMKFELKFLPMQSYQVTVEQIVEDKRTYVQKQQNIDQSMGILFRAMNLDTYFMLELHYRNNENSLYVKPHVRMDGFWEYVEDRKINGALNVNDFFKIKLEVIDRIATLFMNGKSIYEWLLPTHTDLFGASRDYKDLNTKNTENRQASEANSVPSIPFLNRYGMIGFRADWGQGAILKSLRIKTLSKLDSMLLIHSRFGL